MFPQLIAPIVAGALIFCANPGKAELYLADDFNDGVINASVWQVLSTGLLATASIVGIIIKRSFKRCGGSVQ